MNLSLLQLGDSALPIGGYSHSWGLEAAVERGSVNDPESLERWVLHWLRYSFGPMEGVIVGAVARAVSQGQWKTFCRANEILWAGLLPPTLRNASREMGEQLLNLAECWPWAAPLWDRIPILSKPDRIGILSHEMHHAVVFAALASTAGASPDEALLVYLHQAALGMIGAGVRVIPIGHTHGQQILARLHPELVRLGAELITRDLETAGSNCPAYEELCHAQQHLYTRLFRS